MSRIGGKDTKPEIRTRKILHRMGYRFRKNVKSMPGSPDIVMAGYKTVIFVHGCFWHQHPDCIEAYKVKHHDDEKKRKWWKEKLDDNVARDRRQIKTLKKAGWNVGIIWECQTKKLEKLPAILQRIINKSGGYQGRYRRRVELHLDKNKENS